jgi:hypothetical protein
MIGGAAFPNGFETLWEIFFFFSENVKWCLGALIKKILYNKNIL